MKNSIVKATNSPALKVKSTVKAARLACAVAFAALPTFVWKATGQSLPEPVVEARLVPPGWQVQVASSRHFLLTSPHNEKVWMDVWDVPMDAQSMAWTSQLYPQSNPMQIYSPPLAPIDVLKQLYPRVAQGVVQNLSVVRSNTVPVSVGVQAGVFHYRYLYQAQRPYEGEILIMTLPPVHLGVVNYWNLITFGGEGPAEFFQKNKALYVAVLNYLKYNQVALNQLAREPFDRMWENDPEYNKRMDKLIESLGAGYPFVGPNGEKAKIYHPLPPGIKLWLCGSQVIEKAEPPSPYCVPLRPAEYFDK